MTQVDVSLRYRHPHREGASMWTRAYARCKEHPSNWELQATAWVCPCKIRHEKPCPNHLKPNEEGL